MSVCLDTGNVLANQVSTSTAPQSPNDSTTSSSSSTSLVTVTNPSITTEQQQQNEQSTITQPVRTVTAKIPTAAANTATLSKASLITVLNTPLGNVKTLCVTPAVSSNATGQFTVVNSAAPLNVSTSTVVKSQTITLINTPVTVVKTISPNIEKSGIENVSNNNNNNNSNNNNLSVVSGPNNNNNNNASITSVPPLIENRGHNVFVKNTSCNGSDNIHSSNGQENIPQSHKLLTANNFQTNNVLTTTTLNTVDTQKTSNGQRNKVKILSNILMPGTSQNSNNMLNKNTPNSSSISVSSTSSTGITPISTVINTTAAATTSTTSRFIPRQKLFNTNNINNNNNTKYLNKSSMNITNKSNINPLMKTTTVGVGGVAVTATTTPIQKIVYPAHKSQIKTIPPVNNYVQQQQQQSNKAHGIKTLPPKNIASTQIQRTGTGLRTIPPQNRPQKLPNKPNYIGKHAIQAHKLKQPNKLKTINKSNQIYNNYSTTTAAIQHQQQEKPQMTFTQALTAEILETLGNKSSNNCYTTNKNYDISPSRLENYSQELKTPYQNECMKSSIQEERNKSGLDALSLICQAVLLDHNYNATLPPDSPTPRTVPSSTPSPMNGMSVMFSPNSGKRRTLSSSSQLPSFNLSSIPNSNNQIDIQDDDAASDISDVSDRKPDTEGEETDTAPEAEAVNNEDQFGDYVTRCICGFLHDDGYMVECDRCKVWQHVQCVVKNKQIPDEYLCEVCDPHKHIDRHKARIVQQQWLKDRQLMDPKLRKDTKLKENFKHKDIITDSDTSDGEHTTNNNNNNNNILTKGRSNLMNRRKTDNQKPNTTVRQRREAIKDATHRRQVKKRERKAVRRKARVQIKSHSDDENHDASSTHLPQLRQWIDNYEEAVTNHYSPELRARISSIRVNGTHNDVQIEYDASINKCRIHTQPLTEIKYLISTINLPPNTPVIELRGKYMLSTQQIKSGNNCNTRQHSQRPGPFLFFYRLHKDNTEVCVDTRTYGNSARFIRRSCKPNAELRHSIVKGVLHLYIVTITNVDKNVELTIKHESHDLAAIGTTHIACACGNLEECTVNKTTIKKNGDSTEIHRKRRGRRTVSVSASVDDTPIKYKTKETTLSSPIADTTVKEEIEIETKNIKEEDDDKNDIKIKNEEQELDEKPPVKEAIKTEDEANTTSDSSSAPPRRSSCHQKNDKEDAKETDSKDDNKNKKLSREERKLEAILRAIAQMEKADQRKQEHQAKQAHRRESEPSLIKDDDKPEPKIRRKRRKGRARASSTNTQSINSRRNRLNSTDSYMTSGDETLLSPNEHIRTNISRNSSDYKDSDTIDHHHSSSNQDAGLLLALSNSGNDGKIVNNKSPTREVDSNSNSAQSSPETHLSSACLLVQAAVEPMEAGFKFPKTKKGLMNEWLNKVPDTTIQSASSISPSSLTPHINTSSTSISTTSTTITTAATTTIDYDTNFYTTGKNLGTLAQVASFCDNNLQPRDSAKKRWLRQAISEDQCDSPLGRPESPPLNDTVAPPKKRRLPRESLSTDTTPPSTPTNQLPSNNNDRPISQDGCVDVYNGADDDSVPQTIENEVSIEETIVETKQQQFTPIQEQQRSEISVNLMDPRLSRDHRHIFSSSEHLVGTVEKTLSILGFEDRKPESITPTKRKLSITEYRQRKKMTKNDKMKNEENESETISNEENNSLESFKPPRLRSNSTSSSSRSSETSSDDEMPSPLELPAPSAFNSEPTELERQREMTSLRLKKAFGISVDEEKRKPALDVDAILSCEIPSVVKTIPPSPNFPIPGSCDVNLSTSVTPTELSTSRPVSPIINRKSPIEQLDEQQQSDEQEEEQEHEQKEQDDDIKTNEISNKIIEDTVEIKPNLYYTPDEEEEEEQVINENPHGDYDEMDTVDYVPPFNNPIYPNDNSFTTYSSVIDEDRYEGRNPSPPPDLDSSNSGTFSLHQA